MLNVAILGLVLIALFCCPLTRSFAAITLVILGLSIDGCEDAEPKKETVTINNENYANLELHEARCHCNDELERAVSGGMPAEYIASIREKQNVLLGGVAPKARGWIDRHIMLNRKGEVVSAPNRHERRRLAAIERRSA